MVVLEKYSQKEEKIGSSILIDDCINYDLKLYVNNKRLWFFFESVIFLVLKFLHLLSAGVGKTLDNFWSFSMRLNETNVGTYT